MTDAQIKRLTASRVSGIMGILRAHYGHTLDTPRITYGIRNPSLLGTGGGKVTRMFGVTELRYVSKSARVAFNLRGLREFPEKAMQTIGHEVAHAVELQLDPRAAKYTDHGPLWREIMGVLQLPTDKHTVHDTVKLGAIPAVCGCAGRIHSFTARTAPRVAQFRCRVCKQTLKLQAA